MTFDHEKFELEERQRRGGKPWPGRAALTALTAGMAFALAGCALTPRFVTARDILDQYGWTELSDLTAEELIEEDTESVLEQIEDAPILEELISEAAIEAVTEPAADEEGEAKAQAETDLARSAEGVEDIGAARERADAYVDGAHFLIPGWGEAAFRGLPRPVQGIGLLRAALAQRLENYDGAWSVCVRDLRTGESLEIGSGPMHSASLMKLFILGCLYEDIREGRVERTADLVQRMNSMISASSNSSANAILQTLGQGDYTAGIARLNRYIRENGYSGDTIAYNPFQETALVLDAAHSNQTTASDVAELLERIYRRSFGTRSVCNETEQMLLNQELRYKIPKALPEGTQAGNKTGETDEVEHDAAIVYTSAGDYILVILSGGWSDKRLAEERFAPLSAETYRYFTDKDYWKRFYPYLEEAKQIPEV